MNGSDQSLEFTAVKIYNKNSLIKKETAHFVPWSSLYHSQLRQVQNYLRRRRESPLKIKNVCPKLERV